MTAPAAISGDFATYKHVQGRKIMQLVIEVPAEMASAVFAALGTPGSGEAIPVALARLTIAPTHTEPTPGTSSSTTAVRRPFSELPYSQQAAMRCGEHQFWEFLRWRGAPLIINADEAAYHLRNTCGVGSRSEISKGTAAGSAWERLDADYYAWSRGMR